MSADAEVLTVLARQRDRESGVPFVAGVLSWPGFTEDEREEAWDRFAAAVTDGGAAGIAEARRYLVNGPAS